VFFVFGVGVATALAAGTELRLSPRHAMLTHSFKTYALFVVLLVLPTAAYFYVFHGDWFLLYVLDAGRIPSAVALLAFLALCAIAVAGFSLGAALARNQRTNAGHALVGVSFALALAVVLVWHKRLSLVGTFAQYRGDFGLQSYGGALLHGGLATGAILLLGTTYLLVRIRLARRRG
jgi:hypothetical protein